MSQMKVIAVWDGNVPSLSHTVASVRIWFICEFEIIGWCNLSGAEQNLLFKLEAFASLLLTSCYSPLGRTDNMLFLRKGS